MILSVAIAKYRVRFYLHDKILNKNAAFYENESEVPTEFFRIRYEVVEVNEPFEVGDIVDFKTILRGEEWTEEERKEFLMMTVVASNFAEIEEGRLTIPIEEVDGKPHLFNTCFDRLKKRRLKFTDEDKMRRMSKPEPVIIVKPSPPKKEVRKVSKKKTRPIISVM